MKSNTIAVLPFVNMSPDPENEFFSDGITEEIINALAAIPQLKVISRTSSFYFKNKPLPLKEIASQLDVANILEGSIRVAGEKVRITAQLIQAEDDFHFWSESWNRNLENIFEIQNEISLLIAERLREQAGHFIIGDALVNKQTESLDAYAYSLKARHHFNKWNPEDVRKAVHLYEKALELDQNHSESWLGLADAYGFLGTTESIPGDEAWKKVVDYTHKALELSPEHPGVHYQLANLSFFTDCNYREAMIHTDKSLEYRPGYPEARQFKAFLYILSGDMEEAFRHLQLALGVDPLNQETLFYKAYYYYRNSEIPTATEILKELLEKNPRNIPAIMVYSYCLLAEQKYREVLDYMAEIPKEAIIPGEKTGIECLAHIYLGNEKQISAYMGKLEKEALNPMAQQAHSYLFMALAVQGRKDEAFAWLGKGLKMKSSILLLAFAEPIVSGLKIDPRYSEYQQKIFGTEPSPVRTVSEKPPLLDEQTAEKYLEHLTRFVEEEKPYLNPSLTLRTLGSQLDIHPNQLSWLLNEKTGKNFNVYINHFRIEHFKMLALDPGNSHISLLGLAYESGFNSKTVFNTFFKKETGMTPKAFLKAGKEKRSEL